jgi:hypothetical protein
MRPAGADGHRRSAGYDSVNWLKTLAVKAARSLHYYFPCLPIMVILWV